MVQIFNSETYTAIVSEQLGTLTFPKKTLVFRKDADSMSVITAEQKTIVSTLFSELSFPAYGTDEARFLAIVNKHNSETADVEGFASISWITLENNEIILDISNSSGAYANVNVLLVGETEPVSLGWNDNSGFYSMGIIGTGAVFALSDNYIITLQISSRADGSDIIAEASFNSYSGGEFPFVPLPGGSPVDTFDSRFLPTVTSSYILLQEGSNPAVIRVDGTIVFDPNDLEEETVVFLAYMRDDSTGSIISTLSLLVSNPSL